jgi:hypothetical protein
MATLTVIKFKGLTDRTGKSNYLAGLNGNIFQSSRTPYEATYQINFNNDSTPVSFYPTQGILNSTALADGDSYGAQYQISRIIYSLNKNVSIAYDTVGLLECAANYRAFQNNMLLNNFLNYNKTLSTTFTIITGNETGIVFTPQNGTSGFVQFTINYFDKYIIPPSGV